MARKPIPAYIGRRLDLNDLSSSRQPLQLLDEAGPLSQSDAARRLGMSPGTCSLHFQRLEHEGLIRQVDRLRRRRGRPTLTWSIADERNGCVSFVIDGPWLRASLTDFAGAALQSRREDLSALRSGQQVLNLADRLMRGFTRQAAAAALKIRQVFVALPGLLESETGAVREAVNVPVLNGLDFRAHIETAFHVPCFAGSLGLAYYYGETEHLPNELTAMVLYWDLGVGVVFGRGPHILSPAAIAGGEARHIAELGHIRVAHAGRLCHCGNADCLEAYTGGWALIEELRPAGVSNLHELVAAVQANRREAVTAARRAARLFGRHLVWAVQLMGVQRIVLSGPLAPVFKHVIGAFEEGLAVVFGREEIAAFEIEVSPAQDVRMQRGAHLVARHLFFHPERRAELPRGQPALTRR